MEPLIVLAKAAAATSAATTPLWVTVLVGIVGAVATLLVALGGAIAKDRARRRENHAAAVRTLIGWRELPYQLRRRVDDSDSEIARLRDLAHTLQRDISYYETLLTSENRHLGRAYAAAAGAIKQDASDHIKDAWTGPPADGPAGQVLDNWGPGAPNGKLQVLLDELPWRFGWRRLVPRSFRS